MENSLMARGFAVAALIAVRCSAVLAAGASQTEKLAAVDLAQYADIFENEVFDLQDLAEGAEIQRRFFNRITPPGISWVQPMFPPLAPFEAENFTDSFLDALLGEAKYSVAIYPLSLALDPGTRETLVFNAEGNLMASLPGDWISREWPEDADPSRVSLQLDLLPAEDVEPYLYTESRIATYEKTRTAKATKSGAMVLQSVGANEFRIAGIERLSNGNTQITVTNAADAAEVYAYTVWHTSSVSVVVWTNELDEVLTNHFTAWHSLSPPFNGRESEWECLTTNLTLSGGVGVYEDANIPNNARIRFYAVAKRLDSDGGGLSDGAEIFLYQTDPDKPDTDDDGLSDYEEVIIYAANPTNPDSDGDGLPDGWEIQHEIDPLDDGSMNPNNGPEGDPDGDGFSNLLELELGSPPNNPAWNGQQLAYRLTHVQSSGGGLRVDIEDSENCGGSNNGRQNVVDELYVGNLKVCGYFVDITVEGVVEDQNDYYDQVHIEAYTNTYCFEGSENYNACDMVTKTVTRNVLILPNSTVGLRYDTMSYKYHVGAYAEITGAVLTGALTADIGGSSGIIQTCCDPQEEFLHFVLESQGDDVEIEQITWTASPDTLEFQTWPELPAHVKVKNIKWFPEEGRDPCDRTCTYQITAEALLSNGTLCSATEIITVEAIPHACRANAKFILRYEPSYIITNIPNSGCNYSVLLGTNTLQTFWQPDGISCDAPTNCYFYDIIMAEEEEHLNQFEAFNYSMPAEFTPQGLVDQINAQGLFCGDTEEEALKKAETEYIDEIEQVVSNSWAPGAALRCAAESNAKAVAATVGPLYFYSFECAYPECN